MSDIITRDENGDLALRTVSATEAESGSQYDDLYARTTDGKRALRVVGAAGGGSGGGVSSVNGKTGAVEITAEDVAALNSDASTYDLTSLSSLFSSSRGKLAKIHAEEKMPTTGAYTVLSLGWTYTDSENAPTLLATELATGKFYYYHGTETNCGPDAWQEFSFGEGSFLPAQTGHTGFLQTDGESASWSDRPALTNMANYTPDNIAIGREAQAPSGYGGRIVIGNKASATNAFATVIGNNAHASAQGAIQIACGGNTFASAATNNEAYTFKVALGTAPDGSNNYKLLDSAGFIPAARLGSLPAEAGTYVVKASVADDGTVTMAWVAE